jgi:hypothetical protein
VSDELTAREQAWVDRLQKILDAQPDTIYLLARWSTITVCRPADMKAVFDQLGNLDEVKELAVITPTQNYEAAGEAL